MWFLVLLVVAFVAGCGGNNTTVVTPSSAKAITAYSFNGIGATGVINETTKTIAVAVPFGTNVSTLVATFSTSGVSVEINGVTQTSGSTQNNFSGSLIYKVTAADGSIENYLVTVTVSENTARSITSYILAGVTGTITQGTDPKTIAVTVPYGTVLSSLTATFSYLGSSVTVTGVLQTSGSTTNNFSTPVPYLVTAASGSTSTYIVHVTVALNTAKVISYFTITGQSDSSIIGTAITVTMPFSTPTRTGLVANFTVSADAVVTVASVPQTSGSTPNNFGFGPVPYLVTAASGTTATYMVTVHIAPASGPDLRSTASFAVLAGTSITSAGTVTVTGDVGYGTGGPPTAITFVTGTTYVSTDATYTTAMADLALVISDATDSIVSFPCGTSIDQNLTGVSLTPGVTCITSDAEILNTGVVTLNGEGFYMIRTGGALSPANGSSVAYGGTANATNTTVFWVVGSASLGSPVCDWIGNILATTGAITMGDGATLTNGRVLSLAAMTLTNNTITKP
jgi:hypothetical protein